MTLADLTKRLSNFSSLKEADVVRILIWWAHTYDGREWIDGTYLRSLYSQLNRAPPDGGFTAYLNAMINRKPPQLIKRREGYKLEHRISEELSAEYGQRDATVHVDKLLTELPVKLSNPNEHSYLNEALICFRHQAFRAAIVMAWNLTYDHLCYWILADAQRLAKFNVQSPKSYPKMGYPIVITRDDFLEFKESHLIQIAKSGGVITDGQYKILKEKLDRRNVAAHPSGVTILQPTAEEVIRDLIENIVLKLQ
jgi:hypothetical protein